MSKRIISLILALVMLFSVLPMQAIANDVETTAAAETAGEFETEAGPEQTTEAVEPQMATSEPAVMVEQPDSEQPDRAGDVDRPRSSGSASVSVQLVSGASFTDGMWVKTPKTAAAGQRFVFAVDYSTSGTGEIAPGEFQIRIPKSVLRDRNGNSADEYELSVPHEDELSAYADEEELEQVDLVWKEDGDSILIYNCKAVSAGQNGHVEVACSTTKKTTAYVDMGQSEPFNAELTVTIDGEQLTDTSDDLCVCMNTRAEIKSTTKGYPKHFRTWQAEWGEAPADAEDYTYLEWVITTVVDESSTQPYSIEFTDTILASTNDAAELVGYCLSGETGYSDRNIATGQTATGKRYDKVLTRQPISEYAPLEVWTVKNKIEVTLTPADGQDPATSKTSQKDFTWKKPQFTIPTGHFNAHKRGDGAYRTELATKVPDPFLRALGMTRGEYSRYDLDEFVSGDIQTLDNLDFACWIRGWPYPWTVPAGADPYDPDNYGIVPVKYELTDEAVELRDDGDGVLPLTDEDYQIDSLIYDVRMRDAALGADKKFHEIGATYTDGDVISFYGKFSGGSDWVLMAQRNLKTGGNWYDAEYVSSMTASEIKLKDNCVAYRVNAENAHYSMELSVVPNFALKRTAAVLDFIGSKESISLHNAIHGTVHDNAGNQILDKIEEDDDFMRVTQKDSYLQKKVVASTNVPRKKAYYITWCIKQSEIATFGSGDKEYIEQQSGMFYDLLPEGCALDPDSVAVQTNDGYLKDAAYELTQVPNYKDSGRTLLIVKVKTAGDYYNLYFDTIHSWDSIKDNGTDVYNPVAYETGNSEISLGYPDNGGAKDLSDTASWNDSDFFSDPAFTGYFTDLDPDSDAERFIYAEESFDIQTITSAAAGLTKRVMGIGDTFYKYSAWTTINGDYQYRLRFMNTYSSTAKDLILYDSIENFVAEGRESDWRGTLQSIDLSQLEEKGVAPVVYVSTVPALDLEGETNYVPNNDLTNAEVWTEWDGVSSLAGITAIAIDMRLDENGEAFVLAPGESVVAVLYFKAPASAESQLTYPETYNNVYIKDTVVTEMEEEIPFFIHQDYTTVKFIVTANIPVLKVSSENENTKIPGIKFKLSGISDYGTEVYEIRETDENGALRFENVEKGSYILQEYEANDDWLLDSTEHRVVIDGSGVLTIDGAVIDNVPLVLANEPRIHGDLKIKKLSEDLTRDWSEPADPAEPADPGEEPAEEENAPAQAQAESSVEFISGVPGTTFKLSGTSDYGTDVMMLVESDDFGRVLFKNIEKGTYELVEVIPNENTVLNTTKWVVIVDDNGNASVREPEERNRDRLYFVGEDGIYYTLENENRYWDVTLYKVDMFNPSIYLEGATFNLSGTSDFGTVYDLTETTNAQGFLRFLRLEKGTYILRETAAPTGVNEHGQLGGNRNYNLDPADHVVTINERGIVTIDGAVLTEYGDLAIEDPRALDGAITITKIWKDFDPSNRQIPKLHLSTRELALERNVTVTINWSGEEDAPETRPNSVHLYVGTEDGTVISDRVILLSNPANPTVVKVPALLEPDGSYYVWTEDASGYQALTNISNKQQLAKESGRFSGAVSLQKYLPTILLPGSTFNSTVGQDITSFTRADEIPEGVETFVLSTATSGLPVYGWKDGTDVFWYSDADKIYLNPNCSKMFYSCVSLTFVDLQVFDPSRIINMHQMFARSGIETISFKDWNCPSLTICSEVFYLCDKLISADLSNFRTPNVNTFAKLFGNCSKLQSVDITGLDTHNCTDFSYMFTGCSKVNTLDVSGFDTGKATSLSNMFYGCKMSSLDLSNWDTSNVTTMYQMFGYAKIGSVDFTGWDTSKVTNFYGMFMNAAGSAIQSDIDLSYFDTSAATNMGYMFYGFGRRIYVSERWTVENVTNSTAMFGVGRDKTYAHYGEGGYLTYKPAPGAADPGTAIQPTPAQNDLQDDTLLAMDSRTEIETETVVTSLASEPARLQAATNPNPVLPKADIASGTTRGVTWRLTEDGELIIGVEGTTQSFTNGTSYPFPNKANADKVKSIRFVGTVIAPTNCTNLFRELKQLRRFDGANLNTNSVTNMSGMFNFCRNLTEFTNISEWSTSKVTNMSGMFSYCDFNLTNIDLSTFDTSKVTNMNSMFFHCTGLTSLDLSSFDTSKVTDMSYMFYSCTHIESLDLSSFISTRVTNMGYMFNGCERLASIDLSNFDTSNVTNMRYLFNQCRKLETLDLSFFNTSKVANMSFMFAECSNLSALDLSNFDTSNVTDMSSMFYACRQLTTLDLSTFNTSKVTNMDSMFYKASNLSTINVTNFDTSNVISMYRMFGECSGLTSLDVSSFDTSKVGCGTTYSTNGDNLKGRMDNMFSGCSGLTTLDVTNFNTSNVPSMQEMFSGCSGLVSLDLSNFDTSGVGVDLGYVNGNRQKGTLNGMFSGCSSLIELDLSYFNTSNNPGINNIFRDCSSLETLNISSWNLRGSPDAVAVNSFQNTINLHTIIFGEHFPTCWKSNIPDGQWVHKTDGEGRKLYEQTAITASSLFSGFSSPDWHDYTLRPQEERAGKWVRADYIPHNDLGDGDVEYISEDDEWVKNGDVWTYTFDVFDDTIPYYLYEELIDGYTSEAMDGYILVNGNSEITKTATIVNTAEVKTGSLEVSKTVVGTTSAPRFSFTVALVGPGIGGTQIFSNTVFTDGLATFTLSDGETKAFTGIPEGTTYTVTEHTPSNYEMDASNSTGTILADQTSSAAFTNTYEPPEVEKVDLILAKRVEGQYEQSGNYRFVVQFGNLEANKQYETSDPNVSFTADASGAAILVMNLAADESIQFIDLPVGATYLVTEDAGDYVSAYQLEDENGVSNFVSSASENLVEGLALSTALETANEGESVTATFINTLHRTSDLVLRKELNSPVPDADAQFEFTISFSNLPLGTKLNSTIGRFIADEDGMAVKTVMLTAGESVEVEDIPVGACYQISERESKYVISYTVTENNGETNAVVLSGANEIQGIPLTSEIGTVHDGKDVEIVFTNSYVRPGAVTVTKTDTLGNPLRNIPLRLEYSLDNGDTWQPIQSRTEPEDGFYPRGLCSTQGVVDGTLRTGSDGKVTFDGLSVESTIQYRIVELETVNGHSLLTEPISVTLPEVHRFNTLEDLNAFKAANGLDAASVMDYKSDETALTVTLYHIYHNVVNNGVFDLPNAGGEGYALLPAAVVLGVLSAYALIGEEKRRKRRKSTSKA